MFHIVLVNPEGAENVGAASRAMLNMGFDSLILVDPACNHLSEGALRCSIHARRVLETARIFPDLKTALKGADLSAAVSRRVGHWRKRDFLARGFAEFLRAYREKEVYIVFGREKTGLTNEELLLCDVVCSIPTADEFPSLNLAQAVMVMVYEIRATLSQKVTSETEIAPRKDFDTALSQIIGTLDELNYFKNVPEWRLTTYLRKIMLRARLDKRDTLVISNLFKRVRGMVIRLKKKPGKES